MGHRKLQRVSPPPCPNFKMSAMSSRYASESGFWRWESCFRVQRGDKRLKASKCIHTKEVALAWSRTAQVGLEVIGGLVEGEKDCSAGSEWSHLRHKFQSLNLLQINRRYNVSALASSSF